MRRILFFLPVILITQLSISQSVGIGTAVPNISAQLDVNSTTKGLLIPRMTSAQRIAIATPAAGLMVYENTTNTIWLYNGTAWVQQGSGGSSPWTTAAANIYNSNGGNVGIGSGTDINEKLTVKGNGLFASPVGTSNLSLNLMGNGNGAVARMNFLDTDSSIGATMYFHQLFNRVYIQSRNNTNQLVLFNNGNVGINTALPQERFEVNGNVRVRDTLTVDDDIHALDNIKADDNITAGGNVAAGGNVTTSGSIVAGTNLLAGGTGVITGNFTTYSDLIINNTTATLDLKSANVSKGFVQLSGEDLRVGTYSGNATGKFVIRTGGSDQVVVDNAGNLGINGSAPLTKLHIMSGSDASLTSHGYMMLGAVTGSNIVFDNNEIVARTNGAYGSLILQNDGGSVRIGNVAIPAGYKFGINGKMICEELKVKLASSGWPDYVFDRKYRLNTLPEVEQFILQNKHLPNIPSAAEVEKNGLEVGDMQKRMMEKIEELTLYVIDLQKQIEELKKGNKQ